MYEKLRTEGGLRWLAGMGETKHCKVTKSTALGHAIIGVVWRLGWSERGQGSVGLAGALLITALSGTLVTGRQSYYST